MNLQLERFPVAAILPEGATVGHSKLVPGYGIVLIEIQRFQEAFLRFFIWVRCGCCIRNGICRVLGFPQCRADGTRQGR